MRFLVIMGVLLASVGILYGWGTDVLIRSQSTTGLGLTIDEESGNLAVGFGGTSTPGPYYVYKSTNNGEAWSRIATFSDVYSGSVVAKYDHIGVFLMMSDGTLYFEKMDWSGARISYVSRAGSRQLGYPYAAPFSYQMGSLIPLVWEERYSSSDKDIWYANIRPSDWTVQNEQKIDGGASSAEFYYPCVAPSDLTRRVAVYHSYGSGDLHCKTSSDQGASWSSRQTICSVSGRIMPGIWGASDGSMLLTWASGGTNYCYSTNHGTSWQGVYALSGSGRGGGCVYDGQWNVVNQGANGYCVRRYTGNPGSTSWSSENISDAASGASMASIARTARGYAVVWARSGGVYFDGSWRQPSSVLEPELPGCAPPTDGLVRVSPDPFRGNASIRFTLERKGGTVLRVYAQDGREVWTWAAGLPAGQHSIVWNGHDWTGRAAPSGVYFCRLDSGDFTATRTIVKTQ